MSAYYNENDAYAAQWLRNHIAAGHIAPGDVDERDIRDVQPADLAGYDQCHFFAGIGGWSYALRLAGWPDDKPAWSGSCPCQPLSSAGQRKGHADERHLWPAFHALIAKCGAATIFGEQVAGADGREWLAGVRADLEAAGYAVGAADLCAAGVGAPHIRQRLYWMAHAECAERGPLDRSRRDARADGHAQRQKGPSRAGGGVQDDPGRMGYADSSSEHERTPSRQQPLRDKDNAHIEGLGHAESAGPQEQRREYRPSGERCGGLVGFAIEAGVPQWNGPTVAVECSDGWRRVSAQPDAFPLAHGVRARMGKLRGAGNAIVPQVAAEFVMAAMESLPLRARAA